MSTTTATKRSVKIVTNQGKKQTFETTAYNWGELEKELKSKSYNVDNMKVLEGGTNHTYDHPNSVLPTEDFILFLFPKKSKAGATPKKKVAKKAAPKKAAKKTATVKKTAKKVSEKKGQAIAKVVKSVQDSKPVETEAEETARLAKEHRELARGLSDVKY